MILAFVTKLVELIVRGKHINNREMTSMKYSTLHYLWTAVIVCPGTVTFSKGNSYSFQYD